MERKKNVGRRGGGEDCGKGYEIQYIGKWRDEEKGSNVGKKDRKATVAKRSR